MKTKLATLVLLLCMVLALCSAPAFAAEVTAEVTIPEWTEAPEAEVLPPIPEEDPDALPPAADGINANKVISTIRQEIDEPIVDYLPDYKLNLVSYPETYIAEAQISGTKNGILWTDVGEDRSMNTSYEKFAAGHTYRITVFLTAKDGYEFSKDTTATINDKPAVVSFSSARPKYVSVTYTFPKLMGNIDRAEATVYPPVVGAAPDYAPTFSKSAQYYSDTYYNGFLKNDVGWTNVTDDEMMEPGKDTFLPGHEYKVTIYLTAKENYQFTSSTVGYVNGNPAWECSLYNDQLKMSYIFDELPYGEISSVSATITEPKPGAKPDYAPVFPSGATYYSYLYNTDTFKNDVTWRDLTDEKDLNVNNDTFIGGHEYEARIYLTPKAGYRFSESVTGQVNGKAGTCAFSTNQLVLSYKFKCPNVQITSASVSVTAPYIGKLPVYSTYFGPGVNYYSADYSDDTMFKNDMFWKDDTSDSYLNPSGSVTFQPGHSYSITIYLTPKEGYEFAASATAKVNGENAVTYVTSAGQLRLSYTFPALPERIAIVDVTVTAPAAGAAPVFKATLPGSAHCTPSGSGTYAKDGVMWQDKTSGDYFKPGSGKFAAGHQYTVVVFCAPDEGYVWYGTPTCTVNGEKASAKIVGGDLEIEYTFPTLPAVITSASVTITEPKVGAAPDYAPVLPSGAKYYSSAASDDQYTKNDVLWQETAPINPLSVKSGKFAAGIAYRVTIYLTPKDGNVFSDSATGKINGKTAEVVHLVNGQIGLVYTFPALSGGGATKTLTGIEITKAPTKTTYTEGETFQKTGMTVKAKYSDGSSKTVTDYTFSPSGKLKTTDTKITVSYTEGGVTKKATVAITVNKKGTVIRGDVNGDGKVNSNDAIHLLRHTMDSTRFPINQSGDMNGDGKVNSNDAIHLLRHTMDPTRFPLKG